MSEDNTRNGLENDDNKRDAPEDPGMHYRPPEPLLSLGNNYGRQQEGRTSSQLSPPTAPKSELEQAIDAKRADLARLQENGLKVLDRQHAQTLEREVERFDTLHAQQVNELKQERQAIEQQIDPDMKRGHFNRQSGRAQESIEALAGVSRKEAELEERRQLYTQPLRDEQAQERQGVEEVHAHERENLEREIEEARELGHFPQPGHDHGHDNDHSNDGRER